MMSAMKTIALALSSLALLYAITHHDSSDDGQGHSDDAIYDQ